jgi:glycogen debranching enzyme
MHRALAAALFCCAALPAQQWQSAPAFPISTGPLTLTAPAQARMPFTVAGETGAIFGQGDGSFEAWIYPVKIASHFRISAELADYPIPIDLADCASQIQVAPDHTTIVYSHAAFTVKQHMFSGRGAAAQGPVVFFEIASVRPLTLTIRFTADMLRMWPAPNFGTPGAEWVKAGASGYYVLHTDNEAFTGAIGIPGAAPGIMAPYQERPHTWPLGFRLAFDPKTQSRQFFPLLMSVGSPGSKLTQRAQEWPAEFRATQDYYAHFFDRRLIAETPDAKFDLAMRWAELAIDQSQVRLNPETGLVAGYYSSADSARPGYAWFFGRDTLFSLYAVNSYGDFALTRRALEFLFARQRGDGKIMHEYSQAAPLVDWKATPYFYASADSTPLLVMTLWDYVRASGDLAFLRAHWAQAAKAWAFTRAHDSDGDGIYENTEGTGWVESWPSGMPHQEFYLAALDQQSCTAFSKLAGLMNEAGLAKESAARASSIAAKLTTEYLDPQRRFYAFSRNANGSLDNTATVFPSVAWWDGTLSLSGAEAMLERWASHEFSTDWGLRDVSSAESIYDPISYHQGSVWPLYTGWTSLAEYRAGRPAAGYAHLMQNANQTFAQDLGAVTELLSGDFYQPFGRSSSHQLWSSAMVLTPALRGLFGLEADALHHVIRLHPQLPPEWNSATLKHVAVGDALFDVAFQRVGGKLRVEASSPAAQVLCIDAGNGCSPSQATVHRIDLDLPLFEIALEQDLPPPGGRTAFPKILSQSSDGFDIEGIGGSTAQVSVRFARPPIRIQGAALKDGKLAVRFPDGEGYRRTSVHFSW